MSFADEREVLELLHTLHGVVGRCLVPLAEGNAGYEGKLRLGELEGDGGRVDGALLAQRDQKRPPVRANQVQSLLPQWDCPLESSTVMAIARMPAVCQWYHATVSVHVCLSV